MLFCSVELAMSKQRHLGIMYNCVSWVEKNGVGVEQSCGHVFSSTQSILILSVSAECSVQCGELSDKKFWQGVVDFKLYGDWVGCSCTDEALELDRVTPDKTHAAISCRGFDFGGLPLGVSRQESTICKKGRRRCIVSNSRLCIIFNKKFNGFLHYFTCFEPEAHLLLSLQR